MTTKKTSPGSLVMMVSSTMPPVFGWSRVESVELLSARVLAEAGVMRSRKDAAPGPLK